MTAAITPPNAGGSFVEGRFGNEAGERRYKLFSPSVPSRAPALIVMLHGCTQNADDFARGTQMNDMASERGWHVLYPEQSIEANPRKCWSWFDTAHQTRGRGEPSIIADLTAKVATANGVAQSHTFIAGISAGAAMASLVGAAYPDRFSAIALHSGLVHSAADNVESALGVMQRGVPSAEPYAEAAFAAMGEHARVIPTLVIHGGADTLVAPINGAQSAKQWFLTNALAIGQPLDTTSGATDQTVRNVNGYEVRDSTYRARNGTPLSHLVMVRELGHAWSGGDASGSHGDPRGPSATALVADFFFQRSQR